MVSALSSDSIPVVPRLGLSAADGLQPAQIVAFCQYPGGGNDSLIAWLLAQGARVTIVPLSYLPLDWFDHYAHSYDVALVEGGLIGDDGAVIDFGLRLRRFAPELPIIVLSSRIAASDYSTERMAICDVTLKTPAHPTELIEALAAALENHAYWRDTRFENRRVMPRKSPPAPPSPPSV
ncbi:MAG: hypothetical protein RLZZ563_647 [Pseudomonadota bacterium]|jgi:DNA-binding response OmpR family regulator